MIIKQQLQTDLCWLTLWECSFIHLPSHAYVCCLYDMHTMLHYTSTTSGEWAWWHQCSSSDPVGPLSVYQRKGIQRRRPWAIDNYCCESCKYRMQNTTKSSVVVDTHCLSCYCSSLQSVPRPTMPDLISMKRWFWRENEDHRGDHLTRIHKVCWLCTYSS